MANFENQLFRCSSLGHIMTSPQSKADKEAGNLSESAKTHLVDVFIRERYGRQSDISNKYIEKGLAVEEDSITLYSRVTKNFFKKNEKHLSNDFIKGTPDLYLGKSIETATEVIDIKSSWDIYTFFRAMTKNINNLYYWQLQGYMALTGAVTSKLSYCLVNTPEVFLNDEKRRLFYKMNVATEENPLYLEACEALELAMKYDDIPLHERLLEFLIPRNDEDINLIAEKVKKCREYLIELDRKFLVEELA